MPLGGKKNSALNSVSHCTDMVIFYNNNEFLSPVMERSAINDATVEKDGMPVL